MDPLLIKREKVSSSHIDAIGYDEKTQTLVVEFPAAIWSYSPISKTTYKAMVGSDSVGKFFHANIKLDKSLKSERLQ